MYTKHYKTNVNFHFLPGKSSFYLGPSRSSPIFGAFGARLEVGTRQGCVAFCQQLAAVFAVATQALATSICIG